MNQSNFVLFEHCLDKNTSSELPELDNNILNEINEHSSLLELDDNFLSSMTYDLNENLNDIPALNFGETNYNLENSFLNISNNLSNDNFNSSSCSSTSDSFSPIQITPPETPPNCESSQNNINSLKKETIKNQNKKQKLLPLAPKTSVFKLSNQVYDICLLQQDNNLKIENNLINKNELNKEEISKLKEKARRLRNRQSAINSRQKKIEYVKNIEKKLELLTDENLELKKENSYLKEQVNRITIENNNLKDIQNKMLNIKNNLTNGFTNDISKSYFSFKKRNKFFNDDTNKGKKTISLLAIVFLIGLNMNLFKNDNFSNSNSFSTKNYNEETKFKGRVLLWAENNQTSVKENIFKNLTKIDCNNGIINQNESIILESKLRNWAIHHSSNKVFNSHFSNSNKYDLVQQNEKKLSWYFIRNWIYNSGIDDENKQRKLYSQDETIPERIINHIKPQEDTYYFISVNPVDYLILPLNFYSNNYSKIKSQKFSRPKFSIILPSTNSKMNSRNETKNFNNDSYLSFIQIDCEVLNMKPIQILKERISNNRIKRLVKNNFTKMNQTSNRLKLQNAKNISSQNRSDIQFKLNKPLT